MMLAILLLAKLQNSELSAIKADKIPIRKGSKKNKFKFFSTKAKDINKLAKKYLLSTSLLSIPANQGNKK